MKREYVVTDQDGNVSYDDDDAERPQKFRSFKAAKARAEELAKLAPGEIISIYELTATTLCSVSAPSVSRAHPLEHYKS